MRSRGRAGQVLGEEAKEWEEGRAGDKRQKGAQEEYILACCLWEPLVMSSAKEPHSDLQVSIRWSLDRASEPSLHISLKWMDVPSSPLWEESLRPGLCIKLVQVYVSLKGVNWFNFYQHSYLFTALHEHSKIGMRLFHIELDSSLSCTGITTTDISSTVPT